MTRTMVLIGAGLLFGGATFYACTDGGGQGRQTPVAGGPSAPTPPPAQAPDPDPAPPDYSPLAFAQARIGQVDNPEAVIPPQCYTKTDGDFNPCWTCHTAVTQRNHKGDWALQAEYAFSDLGLTNHWTNLFEDYSSDVAAISDEEMLEYIREDNYTPFMAAMAKEVGYAGWTPDMDFSAGFDEEGFANDGSWWRAFRYKPFLGTFWPTNGATDDVLIRLPAKYYTDDNGNESVEIYKANLAILEASITTPGSLTAQPDREIEPVNEIIAGVDLNGDSLLSESVTRVTQLPEFYVGAAFDVPVKKNLYPKGVEFLHTVRYIDPESPNLLSERMKEVRYSVKYRETDQWAVSNFYEREDNAKEEEKLPIFQGAGTSGFVNEIGWRLQGFIEDDLGRLRAQTDQEHYYCMGCHSNIGVTMDQTFGLPRKVPGADGWGHQDLAGIPDVPQHGHREPEILTYFKRNGGGDEFRNNDEVLARFFSNGQVDEAAVRRAAPGGDRDIRHLVVPSNERAFALNKAYMALVRQQQFVFGRDPMLTPPENVHPFIEEISAGLDPDEIFTDGSIWLDWSDWLNRSAPVSGADSSSD